MTLFASLDELFERLDLVADLPAWRRNAVQPLLRNRQAAIRRGPDPHRL